MTPRANGDAVGVFYRVVRGATGGLIVVAWDFDGPLGPLTDRGGVVPDADGTWPIDTLIPVELKHGLASSNASVINIGITGGSAMRGAVLIDNPGLWVWGSEGAELWDPRVRYVIPAKGYETIQPVIAEIVTEINASLGSRLATPDSPLERIVSEPKGATTHTWHPEYMTNPADVEFGRYDLISAFQTAARRRGYTDHRFDDSRDLWTVSHPDGGRDIELLVDPTNGSLTVRPQGVSKEFALPGAIEQIEDVYGLPVGGCVFFGDGGTDWHAVVGGRAFEQKRRIEERPFAFGAIAVATHRGINYKLALGSDAVALGAGLTLKVVKDKLRLDASFANQFAAIGLDPRQLASVADIMSAAASLPERALRDFEADSVTVVNEPDLSSTTQRPSGAPGLGL